MTITIITPYYNSLDFFDDYVFMLSSQTYSDWTAILVNDNSTDSGPSYLHKITKHDPRFFLVSNPHINSTPGPSSARNFAISLASTQLLAFCDIDDIWHPEKLEHQIRFHEHHKLDLSVTAYSTFNHKDCANKLLHTTKPPENLCLRKLFRRNPIPMLTVILKKSALSTPFAPVPHEDYLFWIELFKANPSLRYGCLPLTLGFYRIHNKNISRNKAIVPVWTFRVFRLAGLSRLKSFCALIIWAASNLIISLSNHLFSFSRTKSTLEQALVQSPARLTQASRS